MRMTTFFYKSLCLCWYTSLYLQLLLKFFPTVFDKTLTGLWSYSSPHFSPFLLFFCFSPDSTFLSLCLHPHPASLLSLPPSVLSLWALPEPFFSLSLSPLSELILCRGMRERGRHLSRNQKCRALHLHTNSYIPCNCCQRILRQLT